jgi:hypothetical protein
LVTNSETVSFTKTPFGCFNQQGVAWLGNADRDPTARVPARLGSSVPTPAAAAGKARAVAHTTAAEIFSPYKSTGTRAHSLLPFVPQPQHRRRDIFPFPLPRLVSETHSAGRSTCQRKQQAQGERHERATHSSSYLSDLHPVFRLPRTGLSRCLRF